MDCFPASMEACFALVVVFVVIFAILGIAYGFLAATMAIQRIWQKHYHILTKRELTKVTSRISLMIVSLFLSLLIKLIITSHIGLLQEYIVEDLHGSYTPPKLDPEHEERLKMMKLL